jgi:hypothetical protein
MGSPPEMSPERNVETAFNRLGWPIGMHRMDGGAGLALLPLGGNRLALLAVGHSAVASDLLR